MPFEDEVLETFAWRKNLLVYAKSGKKVPRPRIGYVAFRRRLVKSSEIIGVLLQERHDMRVSSSMNMARAFPDLKVSRKEALATGLSVYRTGRLCKYGHSSWRFVSNGACLKCCGKLST